jgi:hypothetical protein
MGIIKGLKEMEKVLDKTPRSSDAQGPRVRWLKLEDGQSVKVRFVNELDEDSPSYDADRGLAIIVKEHTNPKDYRRKAVDTMDTEGRDWAEEMHRKDPKAGWQGRFRFYINVLVDDGIEEPYMAIWSQGVGKQSAFNTVKEYFLETGSISNLNWKLKRQGTGTDTTYVLLPTAPDTEPFDWSSYEPIPLEMAVRNVPYAEQEAFYLGYDNPSSSSSATNIEW